MAGLRYPGVAAQFERRFLPAQPDQPSLIFPCDKTGLPLNPADRPAYDDALMRLTLEGAYTDSGPVRVMRRVLIERTPAS